MLWTTCRNAAWLCPSAPKFWLTFNCHTSVRSYPDAASQYGIAWNNTLMVYEAISWTAREWYNDLFVSGHIRIEPLFARLASDATSNIGRPFMVTNSTRDSSQPSSTRHNAAPSHRYLTHCLLCYNSLTAVLLGLQFDTIHHHC